MASMPDSKLSTIARPYALAAFDVAHKKQQLDAWKAFLESAALIVEDKTVKQLLKDPEEHKEKLWDLFQSILAPLLDDDRKNFLRMLSQNQRLNALPAINDWFNSYYAALEKISKVRVITAIDVEDAYKQKLTQALTRRIHRDVTLNCEVDPSIIGGAIIHIGDKVIDGSIRGQLARLLKNLTG